MTEREAIVARLAQENEEFARMVREHAELDRQVAELERRVHLSTDEELELKRIKKLKLAGKDRIEAMLAAYR
ncbi:MAG TPA: YdcH family protein [Thermodesulfobacteriota bacterium]